MEYIYSAKNNAFYPFSLKADYVGAGTWPDDGLEIEKDVFLQYSDYAPAGAQLGSDENGLPCWHEIPPLTHDQQVSAAEAEKQARIAASLQSVSLLQLKLQAGRTLTAIESERLNAVMDYIEALEAIHISTVPDIHWPQSPA